MKQDIRFKGLNLSIDEQAVENGALAVCDGMELHNGALRPCVIEGEEVTTIDGEILYIHELTNGRKNAIFANGEGELFYKDIMEEGAQPVSLDVQDTGINRSIINSATSNGNTLVMLTTIGIKYFRWKDGSYKYLGEMPELEMEFSLKNGEHMYQDFDITGENEAKPYLDKVTDIFMGYNEYSVDKSVDFSESDTLLAREEAMEAALGKAKNACHKAKYFALPFYIRYCYRLWDGRKVMHSAPVLLYTDITYPEVVWAGGEYDSHSDDKWLRHWFFGFVLPQQLNVNVRNAGVLDTLKTDWEDIINSVDVYITPGISRRDETVSVDIPEGGGSYPLEGKWKHIYYNQSDDEHRPSSMTAINLVLEKMYFGTLQSGGKYHYVLVNAEEGQGWYFDPIRQHYENAYGLFCPKQIGDEQWKERLINQNAYYLLRRFDLRDGEKPETGVFPIEDGILENIEAQEQMITSTAPDDYRTHHEVIATTSYVYNNRINLTGIQEIPFNGFPIYCLAPHAQRSGGMTNPPIGSIYVRLDDNGESVYVKRDNPLNYNIEAWYAQNTFVFYPDSRAREMWVYSYESPEYPRSSSLLAHFELTEHPLLNGAYHIGSLWSSVGFGSAVQVDSIIDPREKITDTPHLHSPNYIFTSASGNPFVFPAAHRYAVGLGRVLGIAATAKELSQSTIGDFPLLAFTTDGIWGLKLSSTGSYSDVALVSYEVASNPRTLFHLDQTIIFVSRRSVNQLIGSDVTSLSDVLSGALRDLSGSLKGREEQGKETPTILPHTRQMDDLVGAVQNAQGIYDFVNARLLYFLTDADGTYTGDVLTYSLSDQTWAFKSLGENTIKGIYSSYPFPYIHHTDGKLYRLATPYDNKDEGSYSGLVVSRTIKSDGVRNAVRAFMQDYDIDVTDPEAKPMLMIWGSNDNRTWHYVGRSNRREQGTLPGRIYKYFRIAVKFDKLKRNDLYHGVQLDIVERFVR